MTLIDRNSRELTAEGQVVATRARSILAGVAALPAELAALEDRVIGTAEIGLIGSTARWLVPLLLKYLKVKLPDVSLRISEAASGVIVTMVAQGQLDLGIVNLPVDERDLRSVPLFEEDVYLVLPPDHPLAPVEKITLDQLANVEFMMPPPGSSYRNGLDESFRDAGVPMRGNECVRRYSSDRVAGRFGGGRRVSPRFGDAA